MRPTTRSLHNPKCRQKVAATTAQEPLPPRAREPATPFVCTPVCLSAGQPDCLGILAPVSSTSVCPPHHRQRTAVLLLVEGRVVQRRGAGVQLVGKHDRKDGRRKRLLLDVARLFWLANDRSKPSHENRTVDKEEEGDQGGHRGCDRGGGQGG